MAKRKQRRLPLIALGGFCLILVACVPGPRRGLFNNTADDARAVEEHREAWRAHGLGSRIQRGQLSEIMNYFGGRCITAVAAWEPVPTDRDLDRFVGRDIECIVVSRGPTLFDAYFWTLLLRPSDSDQLQLIGIRRQKET